MLNSKCLFLALSLAGSLARSAVAVESPDTYAFVGTIGDRNVTLELDRRDDLVHGSYVIANAKPVERLLLDGAFVEKGKVELTETGGPDYLQTGFFSGTWTPGGDYTGTWTESRTMRKLPFALKAAVVAAPNPSLSRLVGEWERPDYKVSIVSLGDGRLRCWGVATGADTGEASADSESFQAMATPMGDQATFRAQCAIRVKLTAAGLGVDPEASCKDLKKRFQGTYKRMVGKP
jgi:hypothetical protein